MTTLDNRCLEAFPGWLKALADDAQKLAGLLEAKGVSADAQRGAASALNYLFKSLDLIPDGLEDIGFIDDAFVFRVAAARVDAADAAADASGTLTRLGADTALIEEFLSDVYPRLSAYVAELAKAKVRGRTVADVLEAPADFVRDVRQWAD